MLSLDIKPVLIVEDEPFIAFDLADPAAYDFPDLANS